jgi:hypothetical protein
VSTCTSSCQRRGEGVQGSGGEGGGCEGGGSARVVAAARAAAATGEEMREEDHTAKRAEKGCWRRSVAARYPAQLAAGDDIIAG